jgi:hypothetical protein
MAWYPGATKMELQPESDAQPAIVPTQFILHSVAAPWTKERIFEYWRDSTNLESHFGQSYDGSVAQYIGTQTRADACYLANRRSDGTGAVSIETASNLDHSDPWTDAQVEGLIRLGVWMHQQHGIPLRICRSWTDPGYGYHRLWPEWAQGGTDCPGDARVAQFKNVIFPAIVARATGQTQPPVEDDMPTPFELWAYKGTGQTADAYAYLLNTNSRVAALATQVAGLSAAVAAIAAKLGDDVDTAEVVAAVKAAIAAAVVKVDVTVDDLTPGA